MTGYIGIGGILTGCIQTGCIYGQGAYRQGAQRQGTFGQGHECRQGRAFTQTGVQTDRYCIDRQTS